MGLELDQYHIEGSGRGQPRVFLHPSKKVWPLQRVYSGWVVRCAVGGCAGVGGEVCSGWVVRNMLALLLQGGLVSLGLSRGELVGYVQRLKMAACVYSERLKWLTSGT